MADQQFLDYEGLAAFKELLNGVEIVTATGDGTAYTATIPNLTTLKKGLVITIIPNKTSAATIPSLNVNGLGAKNIKQRLSTNTSLTAEAAADSWMVANKPVPLMFDGTQWVTIAGRPSATALHGIVPIKNGGTGASTAEEARINLGVGGSTLYVNAPAGVTVTAKKGETTYTRTADTEGLAIFESLAVGTWTVQITDGVDTSTRTVVVKPDYSVTMAFFEATINITYPAGSTCTCTDGATTLTAPDTSGTWACVVPNTGTWTVSCTNGSQADSKTVSITAEGQSKNATLAYFASTINITYPAGSTCECTHIPDPDKYAFTSAGNKVLYTLGGRSYTKVNAGKAIYTLNTTDGEYWSPFLVSLDPEAVLTTTGYKPGEISPHGGSVVYNGKTYYYGKADYGMPGISGVSPMYPDTISNADLALWLAEKYEECTTLTAPDTSGTWACVVPNTGTWTVSCTDGSQEVSKSILINTDGQYENVELSYRKYFYNNGDECTDITGGFSLSHKTSADNGGNKATQSLTKNSDSLFLNSIGVGLAGANFSVTSEKTIDFSRFSTLHAKIKFTNQSSTTFYLALSDTRTVLPYEVSHRATKDATFEGTISLDISSITGTLYLLLGLSGSAVTNNGNCYVYEVWAE